MFRIIQNVQKYPEIQLRDELLSVYTKIKRHLHKQISKMIIIASSLNKSKMLNL